MKGDQVIITEPDVQEIHMSKLYRSDLMTCGTTRLKAEEHMLLVQTGEGSRPNSQTNRIRSVLVQ